MKKAVIVLVLLTAACTKEKIVYRDNPVAPTEVAPAAQTPAPSYRFPQGVPDNEIVIVPGQPTLFNEVNAAINEVLPDCAIGNVHCDGHGFDAQSFFYMVNAKLRAKGLWAGQHRDGESDEIVVGLTCTNGQNFHAWSYGDGAPIWAGPVSSPCAGEACRGQGTSYRGNTVIDARYCK